MKNRILAVLLFIQFSVYAQFPNQIATAQLPPANGMILALIDYNKDGFTDVVYQNGLGGNLEIYKNTNGMFSNATSALGFPAIAGTGLGNEGVFRIDYNNDAFPDLLVTKSGANGSMRLFRNNCGQNFTEVSTSMNMPTNTNIVAQYQSLNPIVIVSDVDKDNDNDILFARFVGGQYHISLLRNNGSSFASPVNIISGFGSTTTPNFAIIDFDNDRDDDLLVVSNTGNSQAGVVSLFENNGSGLYSFFSGTTNITNSSPIGFAQIFDYNNDGFQDILLGSKDTIFPTPSTFTLKVYRNTNGTGTFSDQTSNFNTQSSLLGDYFNAHTFDYNNDGRTDILWEIKNTSGTTSTPALLRFNGGSSFTEVQNTLIASAQTDAAITANFVVFDYNNDGLLDIFKPGGGTQANAQLFRNNTAVGANYLSFSLRSCNGLTDPIGTRMYLKVGANTLHRTYNGQTNNSTQAYSLEKIYFGLGISNRADSLVVFWPNGNVTRIGQIGANQHISLSDGTCNLGEFASISFVEDSINTCNIASTQLTAPTGYPSYLWSTSETTNSISVSSTGWYKCTVTRSNGCSASDSVFVALGNADIIQNDTTVISGQSITLDATPRRNCGPSGAPLNRIVNANDNISPDVQYVGSLNGHHYYVFNNPGTWSQAESAAIALGGHLLSIESQEENDFISSIPQLSNQNIWLGLYNDNPGTPDFKWVNCSPLSYTNWSIATASPSSVPAERFVYMRSNGCSDPGMWKNTDENQILPDPCESNFFGVVEFDNSNFLSYLWNTNETTPSITVSPTNTRVYSVQVTQNQAVCNANVTVTVMQPSSIIDIDSIFECKATSALISANTGWDTYTWSTNETTRNITVTQTGWYKVTATFGASSASDSIFVSLNNVQIQPPDTTVCAGTSLQIVGPNLPFTIENQYTQNFQSAPYANWSNNSNITYNGSRVLGPFANDSVSFTLVGLPIHDSVIVSFDLFIHDTWEGDCSLVGSDRFKLKSGSSIVLDESFSNNASCTQSYSSSGTPGVYAAKTGASQTNLPVRCNLNGSTTKYTITRTFAHSNLNLALSFIGDLKDTADNSTLCDESWTIDNIQIQVRKLDKVLWSTGDSTKNITVNPVNPSQTYWVRVPIGNSFCYDTITVNTFSGPQAGNFFSSDSIRLCNTPSVSLSMPAGYDNYTWSTGATTRNLDAFNNGWYIARASTNAGCGATDSVHVNLNNFGVTFTDTTICKNSVLEIKADLRNNTTTFDGPADVSYIPAQSISGYSYLGTYHGHYYYRANTRSRWSVAAQNALNAGGHLAIINDTLEQKFLEEINDSNSWIGLFKSSKNYYEWMNGDTLIYKNWALSEPNASPEDYVYIPGKACGDRKWKSNTDSDTLSTLPCESNFYGLLEIYPVTYSYLWTNTEFTKNNFINPTGDTLMALEVTKNENGFITTCSAGAVDVKVVPTPEIFGSNKICDGGIELYYTPRRPGSSYSWTVLGGTIVSGQNTDSVYIEWTTPGIGGIEVTDSIKSTGCVNKSGFVNIEVILFPDPIITGDSLVCEGSIGTYKVPFNADYTYSWTVNGGNIVSGDNTEEITVDWGAAGSGTVNVNVSSNLSSCSANSGDYTITIHPLPNPVIIGSDTACENSISSYSTSSTPGHVYTWQVVNGVVATGQGTSSVNIIWGNAGSGQIILFDSNTVTKCKGSSNAFDVFLEEVPEPVVSGNADVCSNTTHTYSTPASAGRVYQWTISNGIIQSGQGTNTITVLWDAPGTGTLMVLDSIPRSGCRAFSDLKIINISDLPTPVISGLSSVCSGTNAVYSVPANTGRTYRWQVSGGTILSGQGTASIIVSWSTAGIGNLVVNDSINASGCNANSAPFNVVVNAASTPVISGNNAACLGSNSSYTVAAGPNNTYNWTVSNGTIVSGQGTNSITVNWSGIGIGSVQVLDSNTISGCTALSTLFNVNVSSISNPDIAGNDTVCNGSTEIYSIPFNSGRVYTWNVNGGNIVSGQGTNAIVVFWPSIGSGDISVRDSNTTSGCVALSNPFSVAINEFAAPVVSGPASTCIGSEVTYSTPFNPDRTYLWDVVGGAIISGQGTSSIVVAWGFLGTGTVRVFDSVNTTGCNGYSLPIIVTITDKPTAIISGANSICADAVANYGTIPGANKFYFWAAMGGTVTSGQGTSMATITWDVPGTGYVLLYDSILGSSCAATALKEVAINPNPSAAFTTLQSMGGITFTPSEPNLQCKWYFGDGDSSTQYSPKHFYASNGTFTVNFIAKTLKGCSATSSLDVNVTTVSISKYIANGRINFTAYPNPFIGSTNISLTLTETQEIGIDIYDMSGRLITTLAEPKEVSAGTYEYPFVAGDYAASSGLYLVRLKVGEQYQYIKLAELGR